VISLAGVSKSYRTPAGSFVALRDVSLQIGAGEYVAVTGKSGSGKSTLLNMIGGIDRPSSGSVTIAGQSIGALDENRLAAFRGRTLGFVFQFFQLLPTLTAAENVMLAMDFSRVIPARERRPAAMRLLERTGVADQADKLPAGLSGGQQQRVALARALANDPPVLLADEPTGNLDSHTASEVFRLFAELAGAGKTVVVVTHERDLAHRVHRVIELADGAIATAAESAR
jgi:putative ABC transport system ATP-binding protein